MYETETFDLNFVINRKAIYFFNKVFPYIKNNQQISMRFVNRYDLFSLLWKNSLHILCYEVQF